MLAYRYPLIAREGRPWIGLAVLVAALVQWQLAWLALPFWLLAGGLLFLFRDPPRRVPAAPLAVVSPVDGCVVSVDTLPCPYLQKTAIRLRLRMRPLNVYSVRSPMEGKVIEQWNGKRGDDGGIRYAQWIQSDEGDDLVQVIVPAFSLVRPYCYVHSGERIGQGQRCGFVHLGATIEVWVPVTSRIEVTPGRVLKAGSDTIATLVHERVVPPKVDDTGVLDSNPASGDD